MTRSRLSGRGVVALLATTLVASLLAGTARADDSEPEVPPTAAAAEPVTVTVPVRTIETPGRNGQNGIIEMTVGRSRPLRFMLDTGSVGLRLWSPPPAGSRLTSQRITTELDGQQVSGLVGRAVMAFAGVSTTIPVPFQYIGTDSSYIQLWRDRDVDGILGIGVGSGALTNPLVALPGSLGLRWSVNFDRGRASRQSGALVLGAPAPPSSTMFFSLPYLGLNVNGARLWDDHSANGCWTFGRGRQECVPTWFDSGFTVMRVKGARFSDLPQTASNLVRRGTAVSLAAGSSAFTGHRFRAGQQASRNLVRVLPVGRATINTGNSFFFDFTVIYDVATGRLFLSDATGHGARHD